MPGADVVGVVAARPGPGSRAEVGEVAGGARVVVLVVAGDGERDRVDAAPGRAVGALEVGERGGAVLLVTERQDRRQALTDQQVGGRGLVTCRGGHRVPGRARDVPGGGDD